MQSMSDASTCRVAMRTRSRSTHWPKGKRLSGTISNTVAASPLLSRRWATPRGIRCVPGFTKYTPSCTRVSSVDQTGWPGWLSRIADAKLTRSMSRKGCSPDNAACEGFSGRLKTELFYPRNWQSTSIEQFIQTLDSYIRWYNEKRIKISLGALSPIEYRESLGFAA